MKKILTTALITGLIGGAAFAQTTVSSANVVGYIQVVDPASNKYVLISAPFNSGTGTVSTLTDVLGTNQLRQNNLLVRCDQVIMWDVTAQQYVSYAQKTNGLFYSTAAWAGSPTNPTVTRGQALWVRSPAAAYAPTNKIIYISGDVPNDGSYTNYIVGTAGSTAVFNFIANPYPVAIDLHSLINTNDGAKANALVVRADKVITWDDAAQQYITYALKASANTNINNKWLLTSNWSATNAPVVTIQPGQGFWYQTTNSVTWVEPQTYNLQ